MITIKITLASGKIIEVTQEEFAELQRIITSAWYIPSTHKYTWTSNILSSDEVVQPSISYKVNEQK